MGLGLGSGISRGDVPVRGNPVPANYEIVRTLKIGKCAILELRYPDCTNYEGRKILLFENTHPTIITKGPIDPHFTADSRSPIARFEPTERGWNMAIAMAGLI